jgi:HSP20 family protein
MTNLIRFTPGTELRRMQREIDRLFEGFFPTRLSEENGGVETISWTPRVDLAETEEAYHIHVDLPGLTKENVHINFQDGALSISGERKVEEKKEDRNYIRVERQYGSFYRLFSFPKAVKENKIEASYKEGVLEVTVPKAEESKPRRISVS